LQELIVSSGEGREDEIEPYKKYLGTTNSANGVGGMMMMSSGGGGQTGNDFLNASFGGAANNSL